MAAFRVGDVVRLNSGGPKMTIVKLEDRGGELADVQWMPTLASDSIQCGVFPTSCLTREE